MNFVRYLVENTQRKTTKNINKPIDHHKCHFLMFFQEENPEESEGSQRAKVVRAKATPRVIGKVPGKKTKTGKFAKKISLESSGIVIEEKSSPKSISEPEVNKLNEESSAFDFGSTVNEQPSAFDFGSTVNEEPSAFDFGSTVNEESSAFDFGSTVNEESSAFDFGSTVNEESSAFDFGSTVNEESKYNELESGDITNNIEQKNSLFEKMSELEQEIKYGYESHQSVLDTIAEFEQRQQESLASEKYDEADQQNEAISSLKNNLKGIENDIFAVLVSAFSLTSEAENDLQKEVTDSKIIFSNLSEKKTELEINKEHLISCQKNEEEQRSVEDEKKQSKLSELNEALISETEELNKAKSEYETYIMSVSEPYDKSINELSESKKEISSQIQKLLEEVARLKEKEDKLSNDITILEHDKKEAIKSFENEKDHVSLLESNLKNHQSIIEKQLAEFNKRFSMLEHSILQRSSQINEFENQINEISEQIDNVEQTVSSSEITHEILQEITRSFSEFHSHRGKIYDDISNITSSIDCIQSNNMKISNDILVLQTQSNEMEAIIIEAKNKLPQLEALKKSAVSARNFKSAKQLTDQMKDLKDISDAKEEQLHQLKAKIDQLQHEKDTNNGNADELKNKSQDLLNSIYEIDRDFLETMKVKVDELCSISPFMSKNISPLLSIIQVFLEHIPQVKIYTREELEQEIGELNTQINEAVEKEEFDLAEKLDKDVKKLEFKLSSLKQ